MFNSAYRFKGSYKSKVKKLCEPIEPGRSDTSFYIFNRMIDVLECAAILGFYYNKRVTEINDSDDEGLSGEINAKTMINESSNLQFIYRLMMINEDIKEPIYYEEMTLEDSIIKTKVDIAFRFDSDPLKNKQYHDLFNSYVMGGIDILTEKFADVKTREDAVEIMNDLMEPTRRMLQQK